MEKYLSILDTERFGFPVAKLNNSVSDLNAALECLRKHSVKLVISRVDSNNLRLINLLEKAGAVYKDTQITLNFDSVKILPQTDGNGIRLCSYSEEHYKDLLLITKESFIGYGHYFADDRLPADKCLEIYTDWINRCCTDKAFADHIIVAEHDSKAVGYLAIKEKTTEEEQYLAGVIGAVSKDYRNAGVFRSINLQSIVLMRQLGRRRIENNVLLTNLPVINSYLQIGYTIIKSEMTFHLWLS